MAAGALLIAVGNRVTYGASGLAWLAALAAATLTCLGILRLGNRRLLSMGGHGWLEGAGQLDRDLERVRRG